MFREGHLTVRISGGSLSVNPSESTRSTGASFPPMPQCWKNPAHHHKPLIPKIYPLKSPTDPITDLPSHRSFGRSCCATGTSRNRLFWRKCLFQMACCILRILTQFHTGQIARLSSTTTGAQLSAPTHCS